MKTKHSIKYMRPMAPNDHGRKTHIKFLKLPKKCASLASKKGTPSYWYLAGVTTMFQVARSVGKSTWKTSLWQKLVPQKQTSFVRFFSLPFQEVILDWWSKKEARINNNRHIQLRWKKIMIFLRLASKLEEILITQKYFDWMQFIPWDWDYTYIRYVLSSIFQDIIGWKIIN